MALPIAQLQGLVESPLQRALAGASQGRQEAAQQQELQAQQARRAEIQGALQSLASTPNVRDTDYARIITQYPELAEQLKAPLETFAKEEQEAMKNQALSVYTAVRGGNVEMGKRLLEKYSEAARNGGDDNRADLLEAHIDTLENNPDITKNELGVLLNAVFGPDKFAELMATADERAVKREDEERFTQGKLDQAAATLGLTKAQTATATKGLEKADVETKKAVLELEALKSGDQIIPVEKKFDFEDKLRDEFTKFTADSRAVEDAVINIRNTPPTGAGDISLITSFMKMIDPGSTVREGEFATAENAAGVPGKIRNMWNKLTAGDKLDPVARKEVREAAENLFVNSRKRLEKEKEKLGPVIKNYGLNPDNIFGEIAEEEAEVTALSDAELEAEIARLQAVQ
jgi:hypothetical protein